MLRHDLQPLFKKLRNRDLGRLNKIPVAYRGDVFNKFRFGFPLVPSKSDPLLLALFLFRDAIRVR